MIIYCYGKLTVEIQVIFPKWKFKSKIYKEFCWVLGWVFFSFSPSEKYQFYMTSANGTMCR